MKRILMSTLTVLAIFSLPSIAFISNASTSYGSLLQIEMNWTDCWSSADYGSIVIQIPPTPATWMRISWNVPYKSGEGIGLFRLCVNVPFTQINGQMFDAHGLWFASLVPALTTPTGSLVEPIIGHSIGYGDSISFSFQIIYGVAHVSVNGGCSGVGTLYGSCTQHY